MATQDDPVEEIPLAPAGVQVRRTVAIVALVAGCVAEAVIRLNYALDQKAFIWFDSTQYIAVADHSLFSSALWSGSQPPLVPLMWKLTGTPDSFAGLQTVVAVLAWTFLAWTVWWWLGRGIGAVVGAWVVLAFSLTPFILQWDASVLSETVSLASVAVICGSGIWLTRRFTWPRASLLVGAGLVFELARDEGVEVVAAIGVGVAVVAVVCALRPPQAPRGAVRHSRRGSIEHDSLGRIGGRSSRSQRPQH